MSFFGVEISNDRAFSVFFGILDADLVKLTLNYGYGLRKVESKLGNSMKLVL